MKGGIRGAFQAEEARAWMRRVGYEKTSASGEVHEALMREHEPG